MFTITPALLVWSPFFAGYYTYLNMQVAKYRVQTGYMIGDSSEHVVKAPSGAFGKKQLDDPEKIKAAEKHLHIAVRAQGNFAENVPLSLILIALSEINGAPTWVIHSGLALLFTARVAHVELGLKGKHAFQGGRLFGFLTTLFPVNLGFSMYNFALGADSLRTFLSL